MKEHGVETAESRVSSDVRDHGWHVVLVGASGSAPEFAYTVGLTATFQHLEIAVLGLPSAKAQLLLNGVGAAIRQGTRFGAGDQSAELLIGYPVAFIAFPPGLVQQYLGFAWQFYGGGGFEALQLVWPDGKGRFPWDPGVSDHTRFSQALTP